MEPLKIESSIPLPPPLGFWSHQARRMQFGDSVLFKDEKDATSLRYAIRFSGSRPVKRYMRREKGWRVWKMPKR